jgi:hypothetical protein
MKPLDQLSDDEFDLRLRQAVALPEVPPALMHAAIGLWAAAPRTPLQAALRRISAMLRIDSWAVAPAALGLRAGRSSTRQLLYSADGRDIDLRISPAGEAYALAGQVLGPYESGTVELSRHGSVALDAALPRRVTLDELGEFRLEPVSGGVYEVRLLLGDDEIVLPPIEVGPVQA